MIYRLTNTTYRVYFTYIQCMCNTEFMLPRVLKENDAPPSGLPSCCAITSKTGWRAYFNWFSWNKNTRKYWFTVLTGFKKTFTTTLIYVVNILCQGCIHNINKSERIEKVQVSCKFYVSTRKAKTPLKVNIEINVVEERLTDKHFCIVCQGKMV